MLAAILTLCGATTALAQTSYDYFYRSWDATNKVVNKEIRTCNSYTAINGSDTSDSGWVGLYHGWYVVTGNSNYKTLNVLGDDVHLIIPDMVTLTLTGGVKLAAGKKLTIYSQGFYGQLTIYGGNITANGGRQGAGIGSGNENTSNLAGYITIYGGTVTGTGGSNGAGIGGGYYGNGASLTIWGGTVKATGSTKGAGIGGGRFGNGVETKIYGGDITAKGTDGAAIGGGVGSSKSGKGNSGNIEIHGGTVDATTTDCHTAAIGCGRGGESATILITGGTVTATSKYQLGGAGIGGAESYEATLDITISGGDVTAIEAGKPYIVKWATTGSNISDPVFSGVTISSTAAKEVVSTDGNVKFVGQYSPFAITADNINEILYVASGNKIGYSASARTLRSFRAHFWVKPNGEAQAAHFIDIDWGDGTTEVRSIDNGQLIIDNEAGAWYSLDGRKLSGMPTQKGVYIVNGKKKIVK